MRKFLLLCALMLTGCSCASSLADSSKGNSTSTDAAISSSASSISSTNNIVESSVSTMDPKLKKEIINKLSVAMDNSNPTKTINNTQYYYESMDVVLNFNSILLVDYSNIVTSLYSYSYQKLNELGSGSSEMITTISGTYYGKGNSIGESINGQIVWNNEIDGIITLLNFNLEETLVDIQDYSDKVIQLKVDDDKIVKFMRKDYKITNLYMTITMNEDLNKVTNIKIEYSTGKGAQVTSILSFSYEKQYFEVE